MVDSTCCPAGSPVYRRNIVIERRLGYRSHVSEPGDYPLYAKALLLAALLGCAGCALLPGRQLTLRPPAAPLTDPPGFSLWWHDVRDPLLVRLIDHGLAVGQGCRDLPTMAGLSAHRERKLGQAALGFAFAAARSRQALAIARAYVEIRRDQDRIVLRTAAVSRLRDNLEIAGFRREAGLVSEIDVGLSGVMVDLNAAAIASVEAELAGGLDRLAAVSGYSTAQLQDLLADQGRLAAFPDISAPPVDAALAHRADLLEMRDSLLADRRIAVARIDAEPPEGSEAKTLTPDKAAADALDAYRAARAKVRADLAAATVALAAAQAHVEALQGTVAVAQRTASDARLNYRLGRGSMAQLYISEASTLAAQDGLVRALAAVDMAGVRLWTAQGRGWSLSDPRPVVLLNDTAAPGTACD